VWIDNFATRTCLGPASTSGANGTLCLMSRSWMIDLCKLVHVIRYIIIGLHDHKILISLVYHYCVNLSFGTFVLLMNA